MHVQSSASTYMYMLMRDAERRKKEASKQGHKNNKVKQHSTPKAVKEK